MRLRPHPGGIWGEADATTWQDTKEKAIDALRELSEKYPNTVEDAVIFIGDIED